MEKRKNPEKELQNKSSLFFHIGLLIAMMLCVSAFEYRVIVNEPFVPDLSGEGIDIFLPPIIKHSTPPPPPPKKMLSKAKVSAGDPVLPEPLPQDPIPEPALEPDYPMPLFTDDAPDDNHMPVEEPMAIVEEMPEPNGGYEAFYKYVAEYMKYPGQARRMGIEGKVYVQFVVNTNGSLSDIKVVKGIGAGCDEEVLRIMAGAPAWKPGKQRGIPVRVRQILPVSFKLNPR